AVDMVMRQAGCPLLLDEIELMTAERLGRPVSRAHLSAALQGVECFYDPDTKYWTPRASNEDDGDETDSEGDESGYEVA
ncbi:MAG: hypothetical protein ACXWKT_17205, partial [Caulobacteraceae bacterium]